MLWLIQRDFLQGKTVQAMVAEALQPVANPGHDPDIEQVPRNPLLPLLNTCKSLHRCRLSTEQVCQVCYNIQPSVTACHAAYSHEASIRTVHPP